MDTLRVDTLCFLVEDTCGLAVSNGATHLSIWVFQILWCRIWVLSKKSLRVISIIHLYCTMSCRDDPLPMASMRGVNRGSVEH